MEVYWVMRKWLDAAWEILSYCSSLESGQTQFRKLDGEIILALENGKPTLVWKYDPGKWEIIGYHEVPPQSAASGVFPMPIFGKCLRKPSWESEPFDGFIGGMPNISDWDE